MIVAIYKNDVKVFESEIHAYTITDALSIAMYGQYKEIPMLKDEYNLVEITNDDGTSINFNGIFLGYQFRMSTYEQTLEDGTKQTLTGVTINDLTYKMVK